MKIGINVDKVEALKVGVDRHGWCVFDVPVESLTLPEREALARVGANNKDCPTADFALSRSWGTENELPPYLPTVESIRSSLGLLVQQAEARQREADQQREQAVLDLLATDPAELLTGSKGQWSIWTGHHGALTDPRTERLAEAARQIAAQRNLEWQTQEAARVESLREAASSLSELKCVRSATLQSTSQPDLVVVYTPLITTTSGISEREFFSTAAQAVEAVAARKRVAGQVVDWILSRGSDRLKRCLAEGIDCMSCYRDERLALERPDWRWEANVPGKYSDPRNPTEEAFALLDSARATLPEGVESQLVYWVDKDCDYRGYAVISEYLDREIVYGGPGVEE